MSESRHTDRLVNHLPLYSFDSTLKWNVAVIPTDSFATSSDLLKNVTATFRVYLSSEYSNMTSCRCHSPRAVCPVVGVKICLTSPLSSICFLFNC